MRLEKIVQANIHLCIHLVIPFDLNFNGTRYHVQQMFLSAVSSFDRLGSVPPLSMTQGKPLDEPPGVHVVMIKHLTGATTKTPNILTHPPNQEKTSH